jgi:hypothetical protein
MADSGGEDGGPGLLVVVVDINPNQVSVASNNFMQGLLFSCYLHESPIR